MPDDDLVSLTGFETPESADNDSQEGIAETFNAFVDMSAQSDPLSHVLGELCTLNTKELSKAIKTKLGVSVRNKVRKGIKAVSNKIASIQSTVATNPQHVQDLRLMFKDMVFLLKAAEVFKKANAEGEKWEKNNLETPT
nr:hypothetical protein [Tanacetum cinerariifolium]